MYLSTIVHFLLVRILGCRTKFLAAHDIACQVDLFYLLYDWIMALMIMISREQGFWYG